MDLQSNLDKRVNTNHEIRLTEVPAWLLSITVFILVQVFCWVVFGKYDFPNWPHMHGVVATSYSISLMDELGLSFEVASALDFTNPTPRGAIASILAIFTYKASRVSVTSKA